MNNTFNLSTGKIFSILKSYPQINPGDKVGIMFTGGVESYLIARIAKELYGVDNIVFILITDSKFSGYAENIQKFNKIKENFYKNVKLLGGIHTHEVDNLYSDPNFLYENLKKSVNEIHPSIAHIIAGYSLLHKEQLQLLLDCEWDKGAITRDDVVEFYNNNKNQYPELKTFIDECEGVIFYINDHYGFENIQYFFYKSLCPFIELTKVEVIELYIQMELVDELFLTTSCSNNTTEGHCGFCKRCLFRKYRIQSNNIDDLTSYG